MAANKTDAVKTINTGGRAMTTYYGYWGTGNTYNPVAYKDTNLARLTKSMKKIASGNTPAGDHGWWRVQDEDN